MSNQCYNTRFNTTCCWAFFEVSPEDWPTASIFFTTCHDSSVRHFFGFGCSPNEGPPHSLRALLRRRHVSCPSEASPVAPTILSNRWERSWEPIDQKRHSNQGMFCLFSIFGRSHGRNLLDSNEEPHPKRKLGADWSVPLLKFITFEKMRGLWLLIWTPKTAGLSCFFALSYVHLKDGWVNLIIPKWKKDPDQPLVTSAGTVVFWKTLRPRLAAIGARSSLVTKPGWLII